MYLIFFIALLRYGECHAGEIDVNLHFKCLNMGSLQKSNVHKLEPQRLGKDDTTWKSTK